MDLERDKRLNELLGRMFERPVAEQRHFLEKACGDDEELLEEAFAFLDHESEVGEFLERPIMESRVTPPLPQAGGGESPQRPVLHGFTGAVPSRIGPFRILRILGQGGMGVVYLAEQTAPVRRQVALKLVNSSLESTEAHTRFAGERQAMALLVHPNIARILEAGTTDDGFPYFAMEYVDGVAITSYCDERKLPIPERLELFGQVCRGVEHAHRNQIVHRDLKPSNILVSVVDDRPVPRIIDFGVAKALGHRLTEVSIATGRRMIGTPPYMSPEALLFNPSLSTETGEGDVDGIDTRADIYSLGVLLYELMVGVRPFEMRGMSFYQVCRKVIDEEAPLASERFRDLDEAKRSAIATDRATDPAALEDWLAQELDPILAGATARDRQERFESAAVLGARLAQARSREQLPAELRELLGRGARRIREELADRPALRRELLDVLAAVYRHHGLEAEALAAEAK